VSWLCFCLAVMDSVERIAQLEAQLAAKDAVIEAQRQQIEKLEQMVAQLQRQVAVLMAAAGKNSKNSHLPPSSDGPGARPSGGGHRAKKGAGRKRGGQPGHAGKTRHLLAAEQVNKIVNLFPESCDNCQEPLPEVTDLHPVRRQVTEIPPIEPHTTEFRGHAVGCACGHTTRAKMDQVPISPFGTRLMAIIALLTGVFHLSRRQTVGLVRDLLGVRISLGAVSTVEKRVSDALGPAVDEAWAAADAAAVKHTDATSWLQGGKLRSLWILATDAVTVFKIMVDGKVATISPWFGACKGILVSDRATVFAFWRMSWRQICWAHLMRKFVAISEQEGPAGALGLELLDYTALLFHYWQSHRSGALSRETLRAWMLPVRAQMEATLQRAVDAAIVGVSGACADILAHRDALWTFVDRLGVEPTNNHGERELRGFVMWRRRCFGAQSDRGNVFAERIMTVARTALKQKTNVFHFLIACCQAKQDKKTTPSLLCTSQLAAAA
jgi:transposase